MSFADLSVKLTADIKDFARKMSEATKQAEKTKNTFTSGMTGKASGWLSYADSLRNKYKDATKELLAHNLGLKDTSRIVQGIMVSQAFYAAAGAIRNATTALWDFNVALDYMKVTYSALFGSTKVAEDFMSVLQEHSIETIFDYQGLADASKKLLAYGIEYKNLMFIMEGLTNLGAMSGDAGALDRIALALGQIYTKGKLSAEEMRQLANAYIPITEILQDKFGLTGDDLKRVGDLNLPAADVINAIVDYANENFSSVGDAAMYTITGIQNRLIDTVKVLGVSMMQPLTTVYKSFLAYVSEGLESVRAAYDSGGVGGAFEFLVPDPSTQKVIRQFLANVHNLFMTLASVGVVVGKVFGNVAQVVATAFNILSPLVTGFVNVLSLLINRFLNTEAGAATLRIALVGAASAFVLLRVQALGALVITAVTNAVHGLSKALLVLSSVISKHPIVSLLVALAAVLLGVSIASNKANSSISGVFDTLSGATGGTSSDEVLQRVNKTLTDSANAADQFNNRLKDSASAADELSNAISGAGKEAKKTSGLLSFDEVFKLPEPKESSGSGGAGSGGLLGDLENLTAGFSNLGDALIPEIPDFSDFADGFVDNLFGGLDKSLSNKLKNSGIGALIGGGLGAIIGAFFGNPMLGAKIGAALGGLAPIIWDTFSGALSNTGTGVLAGIGTAISKAFGGAGIAEIFKTAITTGSVDDIFKAIGQIFSATGAKAILKGGIIGMVVGFLVDGIAHLLWSWLDEEIASADAETAKIGQTIGSVLGTVIGGLLGGPAGMLIGSAIGTFAGGLVGLFWDDLKKFITDDLGANLGTLIGGILGSSYGIPGALGGALLGTWLDDNKTQIYTWVEDTGSRLSSWWSDTKEGFSTWVTDTTSSLSTWWSDTTTGFSTWWSDTNEDLSSWLNDTIKIFSDWDSITGDTLDDWLEDTKAGFSTWWSDTTSGLSTWSRDTKDGFLTWKSDTGTSINTWLSDTKQGFSTWVTDTLAPLKRWVEETKRDLSKWWSDTWTGFGEWAYNAGVEIEQWSKDAEDAINDWIADTWRGFIDWAAGVGTVIGGFVLAAGRKFDGWLSDTWAGFSAWFKDTKERIKTNWNGLFDPNNWKSGWASIKQWFTDLFNDIKGWFTGLGSSISSWWDGLWDDKEVKVNTPNGRSSSGGSFSLAGHAAGGVFNREHIARFAEGNKAEAIIPLENNTAMRPFVDAVSDSVLSSLAPVIANGNSSNSNNLPPLYVGTLVADERGLRELYKKFEIIQVQENARRGITATL